MAPSVNRANMALLSTAHKRYLSKPCSIYKLNVMIKLTQDSTDCKCTKLAFIKCFKSHLSTSVDWAAIRTRPAYGSQVMHQANASITLRVMGATIYLIKSKCFPWSATACALMSLSAQTTKSVCSNRRHTGAIDHSRPNVIPCLARAGFLQTGAELAPFNGWILIPLSHNKIK